MDICELSAVELGTALRQRRVTATGALEAVLARADLIAPVVNPYSVRLDARALAAADAADAALDRGAGGPLCGIPLTIKDSHWLAGIESTSASRAQIGFVPAETLAPVVRLEQAGAVIYAKTTVPEFCYFGITESDLFGRTSNPWDPERTPGGSSGGAAAAVAAGAGRSHSAATVVASIRIPAAFCGIVGYKPTFGLVSHEPSTPGWKTLVSLGPLARSVADARRMLGAIIGRDPRDRHAADPVPVDLPAPAPRELRVVVSEDLGFAPLDDDVRRAFRSAVEALAAAGTEVIADNPGLGSSVGAWSAIATAEARCSEGDAFTAARELLTPAAIEFLSAGEAVSANEYIGAQFARERIHRAYVDLFDRTGASVLLTPTVGCEAFGHGRRHPEAIGGVPIDYPTLDWGPFLYDANLAGLPACALPMGLGDDGLPVSLQVLGLPRDDGAVLAAAETIEAVLAGSTWPPDVAARPRTTMQLQSG